MQQTIEAWCLNHPAIVSYFAILNKAEVRWAIFAGTSVSLLTGNRMPTDLDIIVHDDDFEALHRLTPQAKASLPLSVDLPTGDTQILHYEGCELTFVLDNTDIEIMAKAHERVNEARYNISFSDLAVAHRLLIETSQTSIYIANPFDTIAIKAIMQRGSAQNKFDLEDTQVLIKTMTIDAQYAKERATEIGLDDRAFNFLQKAGLKVILD
jgi:hypothetical protein